MKLSQAVQDYEQRGRYRGGKNRNQAHTQSTFLGYRNRLRQFQKWCQAQGAGDPPVSEITADLLETYFYSIVAQGIRPRTQRQHIHALRFLFGYLTWRQVLTKDPSRSLPVPALDDAERTLLGEDDLLKLYEASLRQSDERKALRDRAVISVLIFTAIRRGGLLGLKVTDVDLREKLLLVLEKGNKVRQVPLCDEVCEDLDNWLTCRRRLPAKHDRLFCVDKSRPLGECGLAELVKDVVAIAGLKGKGITPHTMRHAAATRFLNNGASLKDCQVLLGHSDLKTTAMYLHADEQSIRPLASLLSFKKPVEHQSPAPLEVARQDRSQFFQSRRRAAR